jgi:hypothetical protein
MTNNNSFLTSFKNNETILDFLKPGKTDASRQDVTSQTQCTANYMKTEKHSKPMPILF